MREPSGERVAYELVFIGVDAARSSPYWHGPRFAPGTCFALTPEVEFFIGRAKSATIRCFSNAVAPLHLRAVLRDDTLHFADAASTNGTWLDGERVAVGAVKVGHRLALAGAFVFELRRVDPGASIPGRDERAEVALSTPPGD